MKEVINIIDKNKKNMVMPDGIIVISKDKNIIVFNEAASRITGYAQGIELSNYEILFRNVPDETNFIKESFSSSKTFSNLPIKMTAKNGVVKNVLASISPMHKMNKVINVVLVFRDTKEMFLLSRALEEKTMELINQKNKMDAIFNSNIEGTFTIDNNWEITSFNRSAEKITGFKTNEALGKKCWDVFRSSLCRNGCHMEKTMLKEESTIGNELEIINKANAKIPIRVNSSILLNDRKEKIGAVETFLDISEIKNLSEHLKDKFRYENIIGKNKEMENIYDVLDSVAQTNSTVLITGESGTGKELVARAIHLNSPRRNGPFVAINCSSFVESLIESELFGHEKGAFTGAIKAKTGRFELAQSGTLFLDEIGDTPLSLQTKLLRVLETKNFERVGGNKQIKMNTRIIAATNKDLSEEIRSGRFREDFFYRINVINISLPPLRQRRDDLLPLVKHFIGIFNERLKKSIKRFSSEAFELLAEYDWPGNIRELENVIEHCFVLSKTDVIQKETLPRRIKEKELIVNAKTIISGKFDNAQKEIIILSLKKNNGNKTITAKELGMNPSTLWRKMKKLDIHYHLEY